MPIFLIPATDQQDGGEQRAPDTGGAAGRADGKPPAEAVNN